MLQSKMEFVSGIFAPTAKLVDDVHMSDDERFALKKALMDLQNEITKNQIELASKQIELERQLLDERSSIIKEDAKSESWITRSWRPITMLVFVGIIVLHSLEIIALEEQFALEFMALVKIGLGGYVLGRSVEKALPSIAEYFLKK